MQPVSAAVHIEMLSSCSFTPCHLICLDTWVQRTSYAMGRRREAFAIFRREPMDHSEELTTVPRNHHHCVDRPCMRNDGALSLLIYSVAVRQ